MSTTLPDVPTVPHVIEGDPAHLEGIEWLLTNGIGGFAMGTALGVNRRKYHTMLNAASNPPVERIATVNRLDEQVLLDPGTPNQESIDLALHATASGEIGPGDPARVVRFEKDATTCRWTFTYGASSMTKELRLGWRRNCCAIRYTIRAHRKQRLVVRPRVTLRDFHDVLERVDSTRLSVEARARGCTVQADGQSIEIVADAGSFERRDDIGPTVVRDAYYALEAARHQPELESLVSPGVFALDVAPEEGEATLTIAIALTPEMPDLTLFDADPRAEHLEHVVDGMCAKRDDLRALAPLVSASDDFLVQRRVGETTLMTVIAGYPWFADWGRDTMISLPGLMLTTHRFEDARSCLETFARHVSRGMIPNRFDDYGGDPHYNTVDASLWFLHAVHAFQQATEDRDGFGGPGSSGTIRDACHQIIAHYQSGTRFGIGMDLDDALIFAGDDTTQLTWMDAKREQTVFTPRHGKAVEINALWCHGLRCVAALIEKDERDRADAYRVLADRVQESFRSQFTDAATGGLHDCLRGDGARGFVPTGEVRPNQIFAASLEFGPLDDETRRGVVGVVRERLRTPEGLRTLAPGSAAYQARFEGDMMRRDRAYHNGTVWPWLIGHYAEAVLRAESFSIEARAEAQDAIATLIASMSAQAGPGCVGQIAEVYDADEPRRQEGCTAQAWSVAEVLRIAALLSE